MENLAREESIPSLSPRSVPFEPDERLEYAATTDEADMLPKMVFQADSAVEAPLLRAVAANPACPDTLRTVALSKANVFEKMALAA